jgi:hypothetical protein
MGPCRYCGLGASGSDRLPYRWRHLVSRIDGMSPPQSAAPCVTKLSTSTRRSRCRHLSSPRSSVASRMKPTAPTGEDPSRNHVATSPRGGGRRLDAAAACSPSRTVPGVGCGGRPQSGEVEKRQLTDADDVIVVVRGSRRKSGRSTPRKTVAQPRRWPSVGPLRSAAAHQRRDASAPGDESTRMKIRDLAQRWLGKADADRVTSGECRGPGSPAPVLCDHSGREPHRSAADAEATGLPVASSRLRPLPPGPLSDAGRWRPGQPGRRARPAPPGDRLPRCRADRIRQPGRPRVRYLHFDLEPRHGGGEVAGRDGHGRGAAQTLRMVTPVACSSASRTPGPPRRAAAFSRPRRLPPVKHGHGGRRAWLSTGW